MSVLALLSAWLFVSESYVGSSCVCFGSSVCLTVCESYIGSNFLCLLCFVVVVVLFVCFFGGSAWLSLSHTWVKVPVSGLVRLSA